MSGSFVMRGWASAMRRESLDANYGFTIFTCGSWCLFGYLIAGLSVGALEIPVEKKIISGQSFEDFNTMYFVKGTKP